MPIRFKLKRMDMQTITEFCEEAELPVDASWTGLYLRTSLHSTEEFYVEDQFGGWEGPIFPDSRRVLDEDPAAKLNEIMRDAADGTITTESFLQIDIRGASVPNVTLLDLPGIVGCRSDCAC